jgi:hypothetical protein
MGYNNPWDPTTSITTYFTQLDRFQVSLGDRGIAVSEEEKTMAAGAQMWNRKMFTKDQMVAWENRTAEQQTWAALQMYFIDKWLERKQYSVTTAKQSRFKEAALLAKETAAAEEEGELQAMLFAMLQEQHDKQIAAMAATTNPATGQGQYPPPGGNIRPPTDTNRTKKPRKQKAIRPHCKTFVLHKLENCPKLEANKDKRWPGWKSIHATA